MGCLQSIAELEMMEEQIMNACPQFHGAGQLDKARLAWKFCHGAEEQQI